MLATPSKDSVCSRAKFGNEYDRKNISDFCKKAEQKDGNADFNIISLIRLLYDTNLPDDIKSEIYAALSDFVFWPHDAHDGEKLQKIVYWSENHTLMLLSSAILLRQRLKMEGDERNICPTDLEHHLLLCFLRAHVECSTKGVYEVLSFVYLPYTLCALLNIVDFCADEELVALATQLADIVVTQMMQVTTSSGVCSLAAAARTYRRFRLRTFGHAVNHFVYCMTGKHPDAPLEDASVPGVKPSTGAVVASANAVRPAESVRVSEGRTDQGTVLAGEDEDYQQHPHSPGGSNSNNTAGVGVDGNRNRAALQPSRLGDFICTTEKYAPPAEAFEAFSQQGFRQIECNPSLADMHAYFKQYIPPKSLSGVSEGGSIDRTVLQDEMLPFFWSAGLLVHPHYASQTKEYVARLNLGRNVHLWPLAWLSGGVTRYLSNSLESWAAGQCYIDIKLNIYKDHRLVLSSFEKFNGGTIGYQQMPWMINLDGVGIWSQSGKGSENIGGFDVTNTHTPVVSQKHHVLVVAFST